MTFPRVTVTDWRAQVEKDLAGAPFDKSLVYTTPEGLAVQPLYTEARPEAGLPGSAPFTRGSHAEAVAFRVCMRHDGVDAAALTADVDGGAESLWARLASAGDVDALFARVDARKVFLVLELATSASTGLDWVLAAAGRAGVPAGELRFTLLVDPFATDVGTVVRRIAAECPRAHGVLLSTLAYHGAGADAADEIALALSTGVAVLGTLLDAGLDADAAARQLAVQISVGRDTFAELAKLRALRLCWHKLFAAAGAPHAPLALLHAVCASRTLSARDPWVNMLRTTTQIFAGVLGGADLVTPTAFDEAVGPAGELGRRVARNTGLVLREESQLGRVVDAAGGSYYLEALTDELARAAWQRFRALEGEGGIAKALASGALAKRLDAAWQKRRDGLAKRKEALTGVSEFANLDERKLPVGAGSGSGSGSGLVAHRDAEPFEALRDRADALAAEGKLPEVALVTLGPPAEYRARLGFASAFFAAGGLRARENATPAAGAVVCLCGSDERYASEAAAKAAELKAAGATRVLLAGRPGALEAPLRAAGVDGFLFMGCDVVAVLAEVLGANA